MEIALSEYFGWRKCLIVPNVSWGLYLNRQTMHECDLLILTKAGFLWEVEIKVSLSDLISDKKKRHGHRNSNIKRLYFAIPKHLKNNIKHIPERSGIISVHYSDFNGRYICKEIRKPVQDKGYKLNDSEKYQMARLGAMRIWGLKKKLLDR